MELFFSKHRVSEATTVYDSMCSTVTKLQLYDAGDECADQTSLLVNQREGEFVMQASLMSVGHRWITFPWS